ncbi:DUF3892 domain-containing protein [Actinoplanes sp. TFC3]|uniref:DUF3892 domain-containing protein n=1 Tax=Actinoplanes sp. TFC3 TaxID=1710355 RepID=UPI000836ABC1|nr:DUF3892 domain-containing protein [Actinoplanes sp. TFC3]
MAIRITGIRLEGGAGHEHIGRLWWVNPASGAAEERPNTRAELVAWIEDQNGKAYVESGGHRADVGVVKPPYGPKYLRTYADGQWTDNLLALPHR